VHVVGRRDGEALGGFRTPGHDLTSPVFLRPSPDHWLDQLLDGPGGPQPLPPSDWLQTVLTHRAQ